MRMREIATLLEALKFVAENGGVVESVSHSDAYSLANDYYPEPASDFVRLASGAVFGIEAYTNGPLSDVTPDEDFGVRCLVFELE
jgi:hypothetical protein